MLVTMPQPERYREPTFDDFLNGITSFEQLKTYDQSGSFTKEYATLPSRIRWNFPVESMQAQLVAFLQMTDSLRNHDLHAHYRTFKIPKKSGGYRTIWAPDDELQTAQRHLVTILKAFMPRTYHTSAFAYVTGRSTYDAVAKHQKWGSNWFAHFDFKDFFGSTTKQFVMDQMAVQYPFAIVKAEYPIVWTMLSAALDICFLDGGLPQGTPISPLITNIMMIPFDHRITNALHHFQSRKSKQKTDRFVYTRYADDIHISCRVDFDIREMESFLIQELKKINAPFTIKKEKTHYGNRNGQNWMLGYILNADNEISIGAKNKKFIKAALFNFASDYRNGIIWDKEDVMTLRGKLSYWAQHEKEKVQHTLEHLNAKVGFNVWDATSECLNIGI